MRITLRPLLAVAAMLIAGAGPTLAVANNLLLIGPSGSQAFGSTVTVLPNGNFVVTDPMYDLDASHTAVGAVYLYRSNATLISTLRGSTSNDRIGSDGVTVLANGNYVIHSPNWSNGGATGAGAVTFGNASTGVAGTVSASNSLVGSSTSDFVGTSNSVTVLANGGYVVSTPVWDKPGVANVGAVTLGSPTTGVSGVVSASNSLVGSSVSDVVGKVVALADGDYLVVSDNWDSPPNVDVGAVTRCSRNGGCVGPINASNSLVGSSSQDAQGLTVVALKNGGYAASFPNFATGIGPGAGAVVVVPPGVARTGTMSSSNALVGGHAFDRVGKVYELSNGNLVVAAPDSSDGVHAKAGSVTFMPAAGLTGAVSASNSMFGASTNDGFGAGILPLANGKFVVSTPLFDDSGKVDVGAVTLLSGTSATLGVVDSGNSLVGGTAGDKVGSFFLRLANGNFLTATCSWDDPGISADVGAVTWISGSTGLTGQVSPANSLVGDQAGDKVGCLTSPFSGYGIRALANGNYVALSDAWHNYFGAATFGDGNSGVVGRVGSSNSLVSNVAGSVLGSMSLTTLANGNYVVGFGSYNNGRGAVAFGNGSTGTSGVLSSGNAVFGGAGDQYFGRCVVTTGGTFLLINANFDNGAVSDVGSATLASTTSGFAGPPSSSNSLVGAVTGDALGGDCYVTPQANGNYVVYSPFFDRNATTDAGAVSLILADGSNATGALSSGNSVFGIATNDITSYGYDIVRNQMPVGLALSNTVVVHRPGVATATSITTQTPNPSTGGVAVAFTVTVSSSTLPSGGKVSILADSGESCTATTPAPISGTAVSYTCSITFASNGSTAVHAEFIGSNTHSFSRSADVTHTSVIDTVFVDSFE